MEPDGLPVKNVGQAIAVRGLPLLRLKTPTTKTDRLRHMSQSGDWK
jgi:hypothetical protein